MNKQHDISSFKMIIMGKQIKKTMIINYFNKHDSVFMYFFCIVNYKHIILYSRIAVVAVHFLRILGPTSAPTAP